MKLVKSLLLGSAAGLVAAVSAQAADLPSRKAAPAEFVRVCSAYGAGFFFIPGTETCLRLSGRVRAEYLVGETFSRNDDTYGFRARGRMNMDARTQTGFGTLRTFISFEMTISNGTYGRGVNSTGPSVFTGARNGGAGGQSTNLNAAFVQFAGITAGRAQSFFDFYADAINWGPIRGSDTVLNLLAYTASFGGGFSATLSLEDRAEREQYSAGLPVVGPGGVIYNGATRAYAGQDYPDLVAALRFEQSWGVIQLSGALHQVKTGSTVFTAAGPVAPIGTGRSDKMGFALQGGVRLNLPMIAPGNQLWLQAAYAEGAISYLGFGGAGAGSTWGANSRVGELNVANSDYTLDPFGRTRLSKGWAISAAFQHNWTPTLRSNIYGSWAQISYGIPTTITPLPWGAVANNSELRIGTNLIWSPVAGLDIGVEVLYASVDPRGRMFSGKFPGTANVAFSKGSDDSWSGRLRIQRDF
jgi:hypothetical protein